MMDETRKLQLVRELVTYLVNEAAREGWGVPPHVRAVLGALAGESDEELPFETWWLAFRSLVNVRPAAPADPTFLLAQDELLQALIEEAGIHTLADCAQSTRNPRLFLWRGDITTLATDAIVNAANSQMTGCWVPLHLCIDNAIHTFAGVQLRLKMAQIMAEQGALEPTGQAKITSAYNLPSKHILHTVGPIAQGSPTALHKEQLASSYRSCLDVAEENGCLSTGFCCISTGVFGFPQDEAAHIAYTTTEAWLAEHPDSSMAVVFNVFEARDEELYRELLF